MFKSVKITSAMISLALAAGLFSPALASVLDRPYFRANALVVVIGATEDEANGGVAPVVVDFNLLDPSPSGTAAVDLIGLDGFVFNSNSGFDAGHDFSGGASRLDINDELSGGNFGNPGGGDIDFLEETDTLTAFELDGVTDLNARQALSLIHI